MINNEIIKAIEAAFGLDNAEVYCVCAAYDCLYNWNKTNQFEDVRIATEYLSAAIALDGFTPIECDKQKTELLITTQGAGLTAAHYICVGFELLSELGDKRGNDYPATLVKAQSYLAEAYRIWKECCECSEN